MSGFKLLVDGCYGIYVPQVFAKNYDLTKWYNITKDIDILKNIEHEQYWDVWQEVLDKVSFTDTNANVWRLYQDENLFAYCDNLLTVDERKFIYGD